MKNVSIELIEKACAVLKPFLDVTRLMSSENSPTVSLIRPLIHQLMQSTVPTPDRDPPLIHQMKATIYHDLETR